MTLSHIKDLPAWLVLLILFVILMIGYYIRPDAVTEDMAKGVLGAILLSLRAAPPQPSVVPPS